jgi:hypothetical protein
MLGAIVKKGVFECQQQSHTVSVHDLLPGIYVVKLNAGHSMQVSRKLVITR